MKTYLFPLSEYSAKMGSLTNKHTASQIYCDVIATSQLTLRRDHNVATNLKCHHCIFKFAYWIHSPSIIGSGHVACANVMDLEFNVINVYTSFDSISICGPNMFFHTLMHGKNMFDRYYCIKTENICYISRYFLRYFVSPFHQCFAKATSMFVLGPGSTHLVTEAKLWPRYDLIESCIAVY